MEAVAEGLWKLADYHEKKEEIGKTVKCLEAICQSDTSFLPIVEIKTRLRIATILLRHSHNDSHAKSHLERCQLILKSIPSSFELKFRTYSLLSQCYQLAGSLPPQKQILLKALDLTASAGNDVSAKLWSCNFSSQLANALIVDGDCLGAISALESGYVAATEIHYPELQMFFATSLFHVHLMLWADDESVEKSVHKCNEIWQTIPTDRRDQCIGLHFYNELLHVFYLLRICDYKNAQQHIDKLDKAMKANSQKLHQVEKVMDELNSLSESLSDPDLSEREKSKISARQIQLQDHLRSLTPSTSNASLEPAYFGNLKRSWTEKLILAPSPIDGEWLPKSAVYALVDLMVVMSGRPKGIFKECTRRIQSGMQTIQEELAKLGITDGVREIELRPAAMNMASVYLILLMHFLENKVAVELTRSEFVEAQEALTQMKNWFMRFPTILQASESVIEMLRGQYSHSVGCYSEAVFHYVEAAKLSERKSMQAMCHTYAAISCFCTGDAELSLQALDFIGPLLGNIDSFVGVREEAIILFAYGLLLMRQQDLQEARNRLAKGLQIAHSQLGNLQLISQYLAILGTLALALHDPGQAREILRSSLSLAKKLYCIPTQIWVLSVLTDLYGQLDEKGNEMENDEYKQKKVEDLHRRLVDTRSSINHIELIGKARLEVPHYNENDTTFTRSAMANDQSMQDNLDIPESVGILGPSPRRSSSRLVDLDNRKRGKRKI